LSLSGRQLCGWRSVIRRKGKKEDANNRIDRYKWTRRWQVHLRVMQAFDKGE